MKKQEEIAKELSKAIHDLTEANPTDQLDVIRRQEKVRVLNWVLEGQL